MDLGAVYAEIETKLRTISGLRVVKWGEKPQAPAAMVLLPEGIARAAYRGMYKVTDVVVLVIVGKAVPRQSLTDVFSYVATTGTKSIYATLDPATWTTCADVTLTDITFDTVTIAGATDAYLGVLFHFDITGT
jgi:hypothetical protein